MDELYELVCGCEACVKPSKKLEPKLSTVSFGTTNSPGVNLALTVSALPDP